jgi:hypothetical protein
MQLRKQRWKRVRDAGAIAPLPIVMAGELAGLLLGGGALASKEHAFLHPWARTAQPQPARSCSIRAASTFTSTLCTLTFSGSFQPHILVSASFPTISIGDCPSEHTIAPNLSKASVTTRPITPPSRINAQISLFPHGA